ncbi:LysR substrate-binding domain-containing protein [Xylophilus sp. GW821-FHT01B05]
MDSLDLIRTFREVALRGSFSRAAAPLAMSKANVSKYVAELESRLQVRLLHRSTRMVSLTDAGSLLLERSTPLIEMMTLTHNELSQRALEPSGRIRIAAPHGLAATMLPELIGRFLERHPLVSIHMQLSNRKVDLIEDGIDLALRVGPITDANVIVKKLRQVDFAVCAAPAYWDRHGRPTHPDALAQHAALVYAQPGPQPHWRFEVDGRPLSIDLKSRMEATDAAPLISLAMQGLGVVCLPKLLLQPHIDSGALERVLCGTSPRDTWLYIAYAQRRHQSAAFKALLAFLDEHWKGT